MNACEFTEQLSAYADGEADPSRAGAIEAHLATCPACAAELADLRALRRLFVPAAGAPLPWPADVSRRMHEHVDALLEQQGLLRIARGLAAVAACVLLAAGLWLGTARPAAAPAPAWAERVAWERTAITQTGPTGDAGVAGAEELATPEWIVADLSAGHGGVQGGGIQNPE